MTKTEQESTISEISEARFFTGENLPATCAIDAVAARMTPTKISPGVGSGSWIALAIRRQSKSAARAKNPAVAAPTNQTSRAPASRITRSPDIAGCQFSDCMGMKISKIFSPR
jgi:hypothetical protein